MQNIFILLLLGLSLSIDAFSISTIIGLTNKKHKQHLIFSIIVGIYHFIMPILGYIFSKKVLLNIININTNKLLGIILLLLSIETIINYLKNEKISIVLNIKKIIFLGFVVSIDSFFIGIGLNALYNKIILAPIIFSIISFSITYLGFIIGKKINSFAKRYSDIISIILLIILGLIFLCK